MSQTIVSNASPGCGLFMTDTSGSKSKGKGGPVIRIKQESSATEQSLREELAVVKKTLTMMESRLSTATIQLEMKTEECREVKENLQVCRTELEICHGREDVHDDIQQTIRNLKIEAEEQRAEKVHMRMKFERKIAELEKEGKRVSMEASHLRVRNEELQNKITTSEDEWKQTIEDLVRENIASEKKLSANEMTMQRKEREREQIIAKAQELVTQYEAESKEKLEFEEKLALMERTYTEKVETEKKKYVLHEKLVAQLEKEKKQLQKYLSDKDREISDLKQARPFSAGTALNGSVPTVREQEHGSGPAFTPQLGYPEDPTYPSQIESQTRPLDFQTQQNRSPKKSPQETRNSPRSSSPADVDALNQELLNEVRRQQQATRGTRLNQQTPTQAQQFIHQQLAEQYMQLQQQQQAQQSQRQAQQTQQQKQMQHQQQFEPAVTYTPPPLRSKPQQPPMKQDSDLPGRMSNPHAYEAPPLPPSQMSRPQNPMSQPQNQGVHQQPHPGGHQQAPPGHQQNFARPNSKPTNQSATPKQGNTAVGSRVPSRTGSHQSAAARSAGNAIVTATQASAGQQRRIDPAKNPNYVPPALPVEGSSNPHDESFNTTYKNVLAKNKAGAAGGTGGGGAGAPRNQVGARTTYRTSLQVASPTRAKCPAVAREQAKNTKPAYKPRSNMDNFTYNPNYVASFGNKTELQPDFEDEAVFNHPMVDEHQVDSDDEAPAHNSTILVPMSAG